MGGRTFGSWNKIGRMLKLSKFKAQEEGKEALKDCAEIYQEEVMRLIFQQPDYWKDLTDKWKRRKLREGKSRRMYEYFGQFISEIDSRGVKGEFSGQKLFVGASPWKRHHSGLRMDELSEILQYKYDRPLFAPAWERAKSKVNKRLKRAGADIFR